MFTPQKAQKLQDKLYQKMSAEEKIKMTDQFFVFAKKLGRLRKQKIDGNSKSSLRNRKNFRRS